MRQDGPISQESKLIIYASVRPVPVALCALQRSLSTKDLLRERDLTVVFPQVRLNRDRAAGLALVMCKRAEAL